MTRLILFLIAFSALAQQQTKDIYDNIRQRGYWDASLSRYTIPYRVVSTAPTGTCFIEGEKVRLILSVSEYTCANGTWQQSNGSGGGGGAVSSVFGRTGAVVAAESDYQSFYPRLSQSYTNPSWLISIPSTKISDFASATRAIFSATGCGTYNSTTGAFDFSACNAASVELDLDSGLIIDDGKLRVDEAVIPRYAGGSGAPVAVCTARDFYVRTGTNQLYICPAGTWQAVSGSSGGTKWFVTSPAATVPNATNTYSMLIGNPNTAFSTTANTRQTVMLESTSITSCLTAVSGTQPGNDLTYLLYKNGSASGLTIVVPGTSTTGTFSSTGGPVSFASGDTAQWRLENPAAGTSMTISSIGCVGN